MSFVWRASLHALATQMSHPPPFRPPPPGLSTWCPTFTPTPIALLRIRPQENMLPPSAGPTSMLLPGAFQKHVDHSNFRKNALGVKRPFSELSGIFKGGDLNMEERHSRDTRDDGTVTLCTLHTATVLSRDCRASFGRPLTKKVMSHSRDGPGVTAPLWTNIVPLTGIPHFRYPTLKKCLKLSESSGVFSEQLSEIKIPFLEYEIPFSEWHPTT